MPEYDGDEQEWLKEELHRSWGEIFDTVSRCIVWSRISLDGDLSSRVIFR